MKVTAQKRLRTIYDCVLEVGIEKTVWLQKKWLVWADSF